MKKTILLLCMISMCSAQETKQTIGMNLPLFIDNTFDLTYANKVQKRIVYTLTIGGSANTRGYFRNGRFKNYDDNQYKELKSEGEKISGIYAKTGMLFMFGLPDMTDTWQKSPSWAFMLGPLVGASSYMQSGITKFAYEPDGSVLPTGIEFSEKGSVFGTGFNTGLKFGLKRDLSCDIAFDFLGFERQTELRSQSHTLGMGSAGIIRINYKLK